MATYAESQLTDAVLMIRPVRFQQNPLTAKSNAFMEDIDAPAERQQSAAAEEFAGLKATLEEAGVRVFQFDDTPEPHTPDSIFPNNWVSFHADGTVVLYPMEAPNRRTERRMDIIEILAKEHQFVVREIVDLSHHEKNGHFLEGTGSLVLDRVNHVAYACLSSRTHLDPLGDFAQRLDYEIIAFDAVDRNGVPIYHTNVLMNLSEDMVVICEESIPRARQRDAVLKSLSDSGHEIISLTYDQLEAFAGNMLELVSTSGERVLAMSRQAHESLARDQLQTIESRTRIVSAPIDRIESSAGGSVRCMLAEIHLPTASR